MRKMQTSSIGQPCKHWNTDHVVFIWKADQIYLSLKSYQATKIVKYGISAEGYRWKHDMQVASKKVYWKNNWVFQTFANLRFFQNLADAFFKYL